jgi:hypothetical protein
VSAATPGQAALSPAFARWYRLDWAWATSAPEFRTDDQLAETWRQLSDGEREFWAEVDAAQQPQPAPELETAFAEGMRVRTGPCTVQRFRESEVLALMRGDGEASS